MGGSKSKIGYHKKTAQCEINESDFQTMNQKIQGLNLEKDKLTEELERRTERLESAGLEREELRKLWIEEINKNTELKKSLTEMTESNAKYKQKYKKCRYILYGKNASETEGKET